MSDKQEIKVGSRVGAKYEVSLHAANLFFGGWLYHVYELPREPHDKPFIVTNETKRKVIYCDFCSTPAGRLSCSCPHVRAAKRFINTPVELEQRRKLELLAKGE